MLVTPVHTMKLTLQIQMFKDTLYTRLQRLPVALVVEDKARIHIYLNYIQMYIKAASL